MDCPDGVSLSGWKLPFMRYVLKREPDVLLEFLLEIRPEWITRIFQ